MTARPKGARRRYVGAGLPIPNPERTRMRSHDPYRAGERWDVPQLEADAEPLHGPVKILAVVDRFPPRVIAGAERMLHHLLRDSVGRGHEVVVATNTPSAYLIDGIKVVPGREAADLAPHAHLIVGHLMWTRQAVGTAAKARRPLLYLVHNDRQTRHWHMGPGNVTAIIWNSQWIADAYGEWGGPSAIIRPPTLTADYQLDRDPWQAPHVTMVNPNAEKGAGVLYVLAARPPARSYLAVQGAYGDQQRPDVLGAPNVLWQPQTPRMRDDVYARTRVLIVPSHYESWGLVAAEAMASGIPVVASPTPGLREALGDAAMYAPAGDVAAWAAALAELDTEATYREWSARARERSEYLDGLARGEDLERWDTMVRLVASVAADEVSPQRGTLAHLPPAELDPPRAIEGSPVVVAAAESDPSTAEATPLPMM